jgi:hypothetical protein
MADQIDDCPELFYQPVTKLGRAALRVLRWSGLTFTQTESSEDETPVLLIGAQRYTGVRAIQKAVSSLLRQTAGSSYDREIVSRLIAH